MTCTSFSVDYGVPANDRRPWTAEEDMVLLTKGPVYGYAATAERWLGRPAAAGYKRVALLKAANER